MTKKFLEKNLFDHKAGTLIGYLRKNTTSRKEAILLAQEAIDFLKSLEIKEMEY